jgi:hypothetical protein
MWAWTRWLNGTFSGWLIRILLGSLFSLCVVLTRTTYALIKLVTRGKWLPKLTWSPGESGALQKPTLSEPEREAGCKQVVFEFAAAIGYIARQAMSKEELENKIYTQKVTPEELAGELHKRIAAIPGITLGFRPNGDGSIEIKLPFSIRDRHVYIIGRSGAGKTNLIRSMILQDAYFGRGVGVLAPEQELLTDEILPYIPENRIDDVVYVNPKDSTHPIAFNPLHLDEGEDIEEKVEDFVTIFKRAVGDTGFRMDQILSETLHALVRYKGSTLDDIERFLSRTNPAFRNEVLRSSDERTRAFFEDTYLSMDRNAANPVLSRISAFTRREPVRNILCQSGKSFNFRRAMDEGKIVLFNLSDGILGEQASQMLGEIIVSKMQMAAMSRADTPAAIRRPFHLYLDEFQTFMGASTSYSKILSRARKYKLCLCIAHQQTGQIPQSLLRDIFGNVTTFISFNVSSEDARKLSQEYSYEQGGQIDYVDSGEFLRLKEGEAIAKIGRTVMPLETVLLPQTPDHRRAQHIINRSRRNYSMDGAGGVWNVDTRPPDNRQLPPKRDAREDDDDDDLDPTQVF